MAEVIIDRRSLVCEPLVSVFCNTYNQVGYIEQCLESLLSQKTTFGYEVLVTDDASLDGTVDVVRSYAERYSDRIVAVLMECNQYSQGVELNRTFLAPLARGRYIAFCEGDDYWIDDQKLQKQVDAMESCPEASWCVHASHDIDSKTGRIVGVMRSYDRKTVLNFEDTSKNVQLAATASFFVRRRVYDDYLDAEPSRIECHGDFKMSRYFAIVGKTLYLPDCMSAYRVFSEGSINQNIARSSEWRRIVASNSKSRLLYLSALNSWFNYRFDETLSAQIDYLEYSTALQLKDRTALLERWPSCYRSEPFFTRAKTVALWRFPWLADILRRVRLRYFPHFRI